MKLTFKTDVGLYGVPRSECVSRSRMCMCNRGNKCPGVNTQIDHHLDLVTAIVARPEMTDFVVADVRR
jgi:hypothetical protein